MNGEITNIDVARTKKMLAVDDKTRRLVEGGFVFQNTRLSSSPTAQANWLGAFVSREALTYPFLVASADNQSCISITDADMVAAAYAALRQHVGNQLTAGAALKQSVLQAASESDVAAIVDDRSS